MRKRILFFAFWVFFTASNVYGADCPDGYEKMDISGPGFGERGRCVKLEKIVEGNRVTEIYTQATHFNAVQNVVWEEETFTIKREYDDQGRPIYEEGKGNTRSTTYGDGTLSQIMTYADGSRYESTNAYNSDGKPISSQIRTYDTEGNFTGLDFYTYEYQGGEESYNLVGYDTNGRPRSVEGNLFSVEVGEFYEYSY
ncbi:MAG: hypothetical protein IJ870_06420 [Alphaproteobacteria bacterium]|nr:hypothetical protein [Alphaproteobacteria bacterium]